MIIDIAIPSKLINGIYLQSGSGICFVVKNRKYEKYFRNLLPKWMLDMRFMIVDDDYDISNMVDVTHSVPSVSFIYCESDPESFKAKLKLIQ